MRRWWIVTVAAVSLQASPLDADVRVPIDWAAASGNPGGESAPPTLVSSGVHVWSAAARLACNVTFRARNGGDGTIEIDWSRSRVLTESGWKRVIPRSRGASREVASGGSLSDVRSLDLACDTRRRFDLAVSKSGERHNLYYPSPDGFSQRTVIDLGDLDRFFR